MRCQETLLSKKRSAHQERGTPTEHVSPTRHTRHDKPEKPRREHSKARAELVNLNFRAPFDTHPSTALAISRNPYPGANGDMAIPEPRHANADTSAEHAVLETNSDDAGGIPDAHGAVAGAEADGEAGRPGGVRDVDEAAGQRDVHGPGQHDDVDEP